MAREEAQRRLKIFKKHAKEVLQSLDQMLKDARREAAGHLEAFLTDEAIKDSVCQKILNDFPEVDYSESGLERLITAFADEVESQLKSNPNSAFNQCVLDADIRLREEFQTQFGSLLEEHNKVIEEMLDIPHLPSKFKRLGMFFKQAFFKIASAFSVPYQLVRTFHSTPGNTIRVTVDLAKKVTKMILRPDNRKEYIRSFTDQVFGAMTKEPAIRSAVKEHLKRPIQYLQACKDAIPKLRQVDEQLIKAETETRPEDQIRIYESKLDTITQLAEELCGFYATDIKQHEFDLTIGKPSNWHLHREGGQGRVYLVQISKDGGTFTAAVKIPRQLPADETMANFVREAENLRKLKGRHVVKYFGTYRGETDDKKCLGLVMEYCPKTLDAEMFEKRENSPAWWGDAPERQAAAFSYTQNLAVQLCEGLKHIHEAGYMHRDLKLSNILVSSEGVVKLADLGSSKSEKAYARTNEGTPFYTAPEVLAQKEYDRSADMYSMGVILLEMWYGRTIYSRAPYTNIWRM
ncbi:uncharacterized protein [Branchiostoma lanceolatum]|uniref:uncharacterized protein n=1 Tax=Branchiostoma lanceolatum TaxID=7740 RepID=UPI0034553D23